jgi:hypothetical protein
MTPRGSAHITKRTGAPIAGQAVVEYILLCLVLVLVATAVLAPLRARFTNIQDTLASNTLSVMKQDELGIPLNWFDLQAGKDAKFDGLMSNLGGAGNVNSGGPGAGSGGNGPAGANAPNGGQDGASPSGATKPGGGSGTGANSNGPRSPAGGGDTSGSEGGGGGSSSADGGYKAGQNTSAQGRGGASGGASSDGGQDGGTSGNDAASREGVTGGEANEEQKDKEGGDAKKASRVYDGREEEQRKSGCDKVDFATLLKILAILGIIVIGAIILLSGRGGGKNNV